MAGLNPLPPSHVHSTSRLTHAQAHTFLSSFLSQTEIDASYRPDSTLTERGPQAVSTGSNPNLTLHHLKRILQGIEGKRIISKLELDPDPDVSNPDPEPPSSTSAFASAAADLVPDQQAAGTSTSARPAKRAYDGHDGPDTTTTTTTRSRKNAKANATRQVYEVTDPQAGPADDGDGQPAIATATGAADTDEWQDKETYALAQTEGILDLTAEDRHPGADLDQPADEAEEEDLVNIEIEGDEPAATSIKDKDERKRLKKMRRKEEKTKTADVKRKKATKD
ncbi:hypothetical protein LTR99_002330 [Exophiala xenobiotica]|uniref:Uncharacterized protein n=1 Tax=Vermiconidia calcicola TaxID=1690605 RepID=A0AAV9QGB5_9PEZI|nr:hypothetical protein H2202_000707 [Exophiala xenobiotica]KAK5542333.1 hypothetical protein LTR25_002218 [Vermiconidia calcicola]KAK5546191.1 hypothetical protein LTR23_003642 [Chaetothyriales sp. CCFEE 6169]KAK5195805.1 hypothetical protein LTR92_004746 [Exophiala xenobiotica]KAK5210018.1 hypothetical protein LTR41_004650 [Exophiala xenobiotica]